MVIHPRSGGNVMPRKISYISGNMYWYKIACLIVFNVIM